MHRFAALAALSLALLSSSPSFAQMITISPEQVGGVFCIARLGNDMAPVEGLLTAELKSAIADAEAKNDAIQKAEPGDKPPLGDGIPWQDAPDYAAECNVGGVTLNEDKASVAIAYGFPDYPDANFTDSLELKLVDDASIGAPVWRIDNVSYASTGDLQTALVSAFAN
ncbi:MAG: hypothetical protein JWQ89_2967 [Devosia sp.]|uniref:hypothetical protein n=1 Tax=Devosia sp. TaxID=1871048 RepID=UPI00260862E0|nr:hypothetical protein [Devosia sp.]MDB5541240.1 hypothetical protein [Devosia sp.]